MVCSTPHLSTASALLAWAAHQLKSVNVRLSPFESVKCAAPDTHAHSERFPVLGAQVIGHTFGCACFHGLGGVGGKRRQRLSPPSPLSCSAPGAPVSMVDMPRGCGSGECVVLVCGPDIIANTNLSTASALLAWAAHQLSP